jgi:hypothetical protein
MRAAACAHHHLRASLPCADKGCLHAYLNDGGWRT